MSDNTLYYYNWKNNSKRATMKNRVCKVTARGRLNSVCIAFIDDEQKEIVSRYALRKVNQ